MRKHITFPKTKKTNSLTKGLILLGSLPRFFTASLIEARSTRAGTPVKSYATKTKRNLSTRSRTYKLA